MKKYKHLVPFALFEICEIIEPINYDISKTNISGLDTYICEFESKGNIYTLTVVHVKNPDFLYISFTSKEIHDYVMQNLSTQDYTTLDNLYSSSTGFKTPFSVLSNISWILIKLMNDINLKTFGYASSDNSRNSIFDYYFKNKSKLIDEISHPISLKLIKLYEYTGV